MLDLYILIFHCSTFIYFILVHPRYLSIDSGAHSAMIIIRGFWLLSSAASNYCSKAHRHSLWWIFTTNFDEKTTKYYTDLPSLDANFSSLRPLWSHNLFEDVLHILEFLQPKSLTRFFFQSFIKLRFCEEATRFYGINL